MSEEICPCHFCGSGKEGIQVLLTEIEILKARIRGWKAYSLIAWQTKRRLEKEVAKEKQRNQNFKKFGKCDVDGET